MGRGAPRPLAGTGRSRVGLLGRRRGAGVDGLRRNVRMWSTVTARGESSARPPVAARGGLHPDGATAASPKACGATGDRQRRIARAGAAGGRPRAVAVSRDADGGGAKRRQARGGVQLAGRAARPRRRVHTVMAVPSTQRSAGVGGPTSAPGWELSSGTSAALIGHRRQREGVASRPTPGLVSGAATAGAAVAVPDDGAAVCARTRAALGLVFSPVDGGGDRRRRRVVRRAGHRDRASEMAARRAVPRWHTRRRRLCGQRRRRWGCTRRRRPAARPRRRPRACCGLAGAIGAAAWLDDEGVRACGRSTGAETRSPKARAKWCAVARGARVGGNEGKRCGMQGHAPAGDAPCSSAATWVKACSTRRRHARGGRRRRGAALRRARRAADGGPRGARRAGLLADGAGSPPGRSTEGGRWRGATGERHPLRGTRCGRRGVGSRRTGASGERAPTVRCASPSGGRPEPRAHRHEARVACWRSRATARRLPPPARRAWCGCGRRTRRDRSR